MKEVERLTLLEVSQGLCAPGLNEFEFREKNTSVTGDLQARPMPRHGVFQRQKLDDDGITLINEIRAIDDARMSSTNAATRLHESLVTPNCEFSARVTDEFARLAQDGWHPSQRHA